MRLRLWEAEHFPENPSRNRFVSSLTESHIHYSHEGKLRKLVYSSLLCTFLYYKLSYLNKAIQKSTQFFFSNFSYTAGNVRTLTANKCPFGWRCAFFDILTFLKPKEFLIAVGQVEVVTDCNCLCMHMQICLQDIMKCIQMNCTPLVLQAEH